MERHKGRPSGGTPSQLSLLPPGARRGLHTRMRAPSPGAQGRLRVEVNIPWAHKQTSGTALGPSSTHRLDPEADRMGTSDRGPPPRGLSWADPPCWPQGPQGQDPRLSRGGVQLQETLQSRQTSGPLRSLPSITQIPGKTISRRGSTLATSSSAWGGGTGTPQGCPRFWDTENQLLTATGEPPPCTSLYTFMGSRKSLTSAKRYFQTASRLSGGASHPQACGWKPFVPDQSWGCPVGALRGWQQGSPWRQQGLWLQA